MELSQTIKQLALDAGFDLCGIAPARMLDRQKERFGEWVAAGNNDSLNYLTRHGDKRFDPRLLVEGARSVIVFAVNYKQPVCDAPAGIPRIASYALAPDYHETIRSMLNRVLGRLMDMVPAVSGRAFVDSAPILEKAWAVEAGLGAIGRNSLLITQGFGSRVLLGELVVDIELEYDTPVTADPCGDCTVCAGFCPENAILPGRCLDLRKCISRHTIEKSSGETVSVEKLHGWIFGCELCQECCPHNAGTPTGRVINPRFRAEELTLDFWKSLTEDRFAEMFGGTPLARTTLDAIKTRIE